MSNLTVADIYGYAQDLLKFDGTDIGLPGMEEDRTINWINDLHKQYFDEFYGRRITAPEYMRNHIGYDVASETQLSADTSSGDTTLTIDDSTVLDTSGVFVIYDQNQFDIVEHSGNTSGTVSGIPATGRGALNFDHSSGDGVAKMYALPSDFGRMRPVRRYDTYMKNHEGVQIDGYGYRQVPDFPGLAEFSVYKNTSGSFYLWVPRASGTQIMVTYDMKPTELTATNDTIDIESPDHWYLVYGLVAIFKQVADENYVPQKEQVAQQAVVTQAISKRSAGKNISGNAKFFNRYR